MSQITGQTGNRFRDSWVGCIPVPLPADYVRGIDQQRRDFEAGLPSYLAGQWRHQGWWYYYLYGLAVKVPLGIWGLVLWNIVITLRGELGNARAVDEWALWLPALAILTFVSSQTGFNHHLRYVLPIVPFVVISTSKLALYIQTPRWREGLLVVVLVCWACGSSLAIHPHYLSYFNEAAGGPDNGHEHLLDSNIDWGQDLLFLKRWLDEHPEARPLGLAYFNFIDPRIVGIDFQLPPPGPTGLFPDSPAYSAKLGPHPGYYAVSVNYVRGSRMIAPPDGKGGWACPSHAYDYFHRFRPIAKAGYSIYIYHIMPDEANAVRRELGLPPLSADPTEMKAP